jgi:hypothetical protein
VFTGKYGPLVKSHNTRDALGNRAKIAILRTLRTLFGHLGEFPESSETPRNRGEGSRSPVGEVDDVLAPDDQLPVPAVYRWPRTGHLVDAPPRLKRCVK